MKKYVKPQLFMESFELTNHISGNCGMIPNEDSTSVKFAGWGDAYDKVFEMEGVCEDLLPEGSGFEEFCYTVSTVQSPILSNS